MGRHAGYDLRFSPFCRPHGLPVLQSIQPLPPFFENHSRKLFSFATGLLLLARVTPVSSPYLSAFCDSTTCVRAWPNLVTSLYLLSASVEFLLLGGHGLSLRTRAVLVLHVPRLRLLAELFDSLGCFSHQYFFLAGFLATFLPVFFAYAAACFLPAVVYGNFFLPTVGIVLLLAIPRPA